MGVIRRQSLKHSIVNMTGLVIGAVSTLVVYPHVLDSYGLIQTLLTVGIVGLPILSLGANTVAIRYFPRFDDKEKGHHGFLPLLLAMCLGGWLLALGLLFAFHRPFQSFLSTKSALLQENIWFAAPLALFFILNTVLSMYTANFKRIVVPTILLDFSLKLAVPLLLFGIWQEWITVKTALWGLLAHAFLVFAGMVWYIRHLGQWFWRPDPGFLKAEGLWRDIGNFVLFGAIGGFALTLVTKVDLLMVTSLSTLKNSGIYSVSAFIAAAIDIPTKSLYTASISSVARHLADNDMAELESLYKKVSINLFLAGLLLFGAVWISVDSLFAILPNGQTLVAGKWVLFFIGISRLAEMVTGLNNYLIYYSRYYMYSLISLSILAVATILLNLWLIPQLGITGAALATLLSLGLYNIISLILVWVKFRIQPFTRQTGLSALGALTLWGLVSLLPRIPQIPILDIAVHSGAYFLLFGLFVYFSGISPDLVSLVRVVREKWFGKPR